MSILLIICVLAAAGWLVLSVAGRASSDDPGNSVQAYSRAMAALAPSDTARRPRRARTAPRRTTRSASGARKRPVTHRTAARPRPAAARSRPVRR